MKKNTIIIFSLLLTIPQVIAYTDSDLGAATFLANNNIIKNWITEPNKFELDNNISRREMLKVMMNLSLIKVEDKCLGTFEDLDSSDWGCKYAEMALSGSFIAANPRFRPNDNITKIESLKLIMQAKYLAKTDASDWRVGYVEAAITAGILDEGFEDFNSLATRGWIFNISANTFSNYVTEEDEITQILEELFK